jgi:hypothetical protein
VVNINERELAEKIKNPEMVRDIGRVIKPEKCHHPDRSLTIKHASAAKRESVDPQTLPVRQKRVDACQNPSCFAGLLNPPNQD